MAEKNEVPGSEAPADPPEITTKEAAAPVGTDDNCVFCKIAKKEHPATIVYEDSEFLVFVDRKPASDHHYLVIPRNHVRDTRTLTKEHIPLVEKMADIGKTVLKDRGGSEQESRIGFHWPPFLLVKHLHLHVIAPVTNMGWFARTLMFRMDSMVFSSPAYMMNYLKSKD